MWTIERRKESEPKKTKEERIAELLQKQKERRENEKVTLQKLTYDGHEDEYILDVKTSVKRKDMPHDSVHVTGKKRKYLTTDLWDELIWPKSGPSAIHMYLWVINEKINPDTILEKKSKITQIEWKKIIMYGAIALVIVFLLPKFIH